MFRRIGQFILQAAVIILAISLRDFVSYSCQKTGLKPNNYGVV